MSPTHRHVRFFFAASAWLVLAAGGCGSSGPVFTEEFRRSLTNEEIRGMRFYVATPMDFRSLRELEEFVDDGPFKRDRHRVIHLAETDPGVVVASGFDWLTIDFNKGFTLTFRHDPTDGGYSMPGWGTITIAGERYDIRVGVLSGERISLNYGPGGD